MFQLTFLDLISSLFNSYQQTNLKYILDYHFFHFQEGFASKPSLNFSQNPSDINFCIALYSCPLANIQSLSVLFFTLLNIACSMPICRFETCLEVGIWRQIWRGHLLFWIPSVVPFLQIYLLFITIVQSLVDVAG